MSASTIPLHMPPADEDCPLDSAIFACWEARNGAPVDMQALQTLVQMCRQPYWPGDRSAADRQGILASLRRAIGHLEDAVAFAIAEGMGAGDFGHATLDQVAERSRSAADRMVQLDQARSLVWQAYRDSEPRLVLVHDADKRSVSV